MTDERGDEMEVHERSDGALFGVFSFLLAAAIVWHQLRLSDWEILSLHSVVTLSALWTLLRPTSLPRFLFMLGAQLVATLEDLPLVVNHWLLLAMTGVALFGIVGMAAARRAPWVRDAGAVYRRVAPALRIQVLLVYLLAMLAKINEGFLDPDLSCAVAMSDDLLGWAPIELRADWQHGPAIIGTILIEAAIPLLLFFRRTRLLGLAVGVPFHLVLALAGHVPFSGFAMAFYSLFLPSDMPRRFERARRDIPLLRDWRQRARRIERSPWTFPILAGAWLLIAIATAIDEDQARTWVDRATTVAFVPYVLVLVALALVCLRSGGYLWRPHAFRVVHPAWLIAPALVVANAVMPYIGLKTQDTFTMYSNLQTEADQWNHEVVPESVQVFDAQDHPVRILWSTDDKLSDAARDGTRFVWAAFRRYLHDHQDMGVAFEHRDERIALFRAGNDSRFATDGESLVEEKLALYRDIPTPERNTCRSRRSAGPDEGS
jgi:hypothetical protein